MELVAVIDRLAGAGAEVDDALGDGMVRPLVPDQEAAGLLGDENGRVRGPVRMVAVVSIGVEGGDRRSGWHGAAANQGAARPVCGARRVRRRLDKRDALAAADRLSLERARITGNPTHVLLPLIPAPSVPHSVAAGLGWDAALDTFRNEAGCQAERAPGPHGRQARSRSWEGCVILRSRLTFVKKRLPQVGRVSIPVVLARVCRVSKTRAVRQFCNGRK